MNLVPAKKFLKSLKKGNFYSISELTRAFSLMSSKIFTFHNINAYGVFEIYCVSVRYVLRDIGLTFISYIFIFYAYLTTKIWNQSKKYIQNKSINIFFVIATILFYFIVISLDVICLTNKYKFIKILVT